MIEYSVNGDLHSFEDCNIFYRDLSELVDEHDEITLDLNLTHIFSSTAAGRMVSIQQKIEETSKKINVINVHKPVKTILKEVGLISELKNFHFEKL